MDLACVSLTGDMPLEIKLEQFSKAVLDPQVRSIDALDQDFESDDDSTFEHILELISQKDRRWNSVKLNRCKGNLSSLLNEILSSNTRKLSLSEEPCETLSSLGKGLERNSSLLILGLHHMKLTEASIDEFFQGLQQNDTLMEISFDNSTFEDNAHVALASGLKACQSIQHLSFKNCGLTDAQCETINESLASHESILELNFEGNSCLSAGMSALALVLRQTNLLVLDLSAQKRNSTASSWDLTDFSKALENSKLRYFQMSDNQMDESSIRCLTSGIKVNKSIRTLNMAWCDLSGSAMEDIADSLCQNSTLSNLNLFNCEINDEGIVTFASRLSRMEGLKKLDLGGNQGYTQYGISVFFENMKHNSVLEETLLNVQSYNKNRFYFDLNRGGQRFFRSKDSAPIALWPNLLQRTQTVRLPKICDPWAMDYFEASPSDDLEPCEFDEREGSRRASVLFHLLRNGLLPEI